jgi:hypothetical protein
MDKYVDFKEFEKAGFLYEDLPTWLELAQHVKFKFMPDSTSTYRVIDNSHSHPKSAEKRFILLQGHYAMKKHFIRKYNVRRSVERKFETEFHLIKFNLAYKWGQYAEAEQAYAVLKMEKALSLKLRMKMLFMQLPFLRKTIKNIKKIYIPKASVSRL